MKKPMITQVVKTGRFEFSPILKRDTGLNLKTPAEILVSPKMLPQVVSDKALQ